MEKQDALAILVEHQTWRRGIYPYDFGNRQEYRITSLQLGQAIDVAIDTLRNKELKK